MNDQFVSSRRTFLAGTVTAALGATVRSAAGEQVEAKQKNMPPDQFEGFGNGPIDESYWKKVRSQFSLNPDLVYLNNGAFGPVSNPVLQTRNYYNHLLATEPTDNSWSKLQAGVRQQIAEFIHARPDEVSITRSTTEGLNILSHAIDWKQGDEVILGDQENYSAVDAYRALSERYGVKVVTVALPVPAQSVDEIISAYARAFTPRTRVLVVSHVSFVTGLIAPLKQLTDLAHQHGALISVDGAQALGALPINVAELNIDHYAAAGQKWLLAGAGTGINYVRKDAQPKLWPLFGYDNARSGRPTVRYEHSGQLDVPSAIGIGTAIQFQNAVGRKNIENRVRALNQHFQNGAKAIEGVRLLSSTSPELVGNLSVISVPNIPAQQAARLLEERYKINVKGYAFHDVTAFRVSTHFYNTHDEVNQLVSVLAQWSKDPPTFAVEPKRPA